MSRDGLTPYRSFLLIVLAMYVLDYMHYLISTNVMRKEPPLDLIDSLMCMEAGTRYTH